MTDLLRGNFLAKMGEKVTFLVALKKFFKKEQIKKEVLLTYKPFFVVGMKTDPPDLKLVSRSLLKKITKVSFSTFKFKDRLKADLLVFFFQIRKWVGCYQILLNSTNCVKGFHPFLLTRISILLKVFEEKKGNKTSKLKKKRKREKILPKSPIRNFICTGKITEKRKEFTTSRHFLFWVVKTGFIFKMLEGYESLTKTSISKVIRIEPFSIMICEEVIRIEAILKKISGSSQKKNFELDFVKKKIIKNSDEIFQKMLIQGKIGKLII